MKLVATLKLQPTPNQSALLYQTLSVANQACDFISAVAWNHQVFVGTALHHLTYYDVRNLFGLSAQLAIRCIGKVVDSYKVGRSLQRKYRPYGAISFDNRILGYNLEAQTVSIWTLAQGRIIVPFMCGEYHRCLLEGQRGESLLLWRDGHFYIHASCEVETEPLMDVTECLGVDLGIVNIAADSDGQRYSGAHLNNLRHRHTKLRQKLQAKGTKAARRLLRKRARKERQFSRNVNHRIAKSLVEKAQGTKRGITLEDLQGIRESVTVHHRFRRHLHRWAFHDLRQKIEYKALRAGVPIFIVDPRFTSRTCPACGTVDKRNRPNQATFRCICCGFSDHADTVAASIIARRAVVNLPYISTTI